jgi:hypothetical protein
MCNKEKTSETKKKKERKKEPSKIQTNKQIRRNLNVTLLITKQEKQQ